MFHRRIAALIAVIAIAASACSAAATPAPTSAPATAAPSSAATAAASAGGSVAAGGCIVGVSWNNYQEERWAKWDEPAIKAAVAAGGGKYISSDAKSSARRQTTDVENLISQGAKVLIILAQDDQAIKSSVTTAAAAGIPVIAYDRLIEDKSVFYVTFDNVEVGRMQARAIFAAKPTGNYVFIKGNAADANAEFLKSGMDEILKDAIASGAIKNVGETFTDTGSRRCADRDGAVPDGQQQQGGCGPLGERRHGRRRHRGAHRPGPRGQGAGVGPGRRSGRPEPRRARDPDGRRLEGLPRPRQDCRRGGHPAVRQQGRDEGHRRCGLHDARWQQRLVDPAEASADHKTNLQIVLDAGWITKDKLCQGVTAGSVPGCLIPSTLPGQVVKRPAVRRSRHRAMILEARR